MFVGLRVYIKYDFTSYHTCTMFGALIDTIDKESRCNVDNVRLIPLLLLECRYVRMLKWPGIEGMKIWINSCFKKTAKAFACFGSIMVDENSFAPHACLLVKEFASMTMVHILSIVLRTVHILHRNSLLLLQWSLL